VRLTLRSQRFREKREAEWRRLDDLLTRIEYGSLSVLSDEEIIALPVLYRAALSALSVARAISLDQNLIRYLESLCTRAYFFVYGPRVTFAERARRFFMEDWPAAVRALWRETIVSAALTLIAATIGYALVLTDPSWFYSFVPPELAAERHPGASVEALRETLAGSEDAEGLTYFATLLFTHNAQIAILAFALGFALCLPTAIVLVYNGLSVGAFVAVFAQQGLGYELGGWLLIHGVTELFAVILAGAAGLKIGWTVAFPGMLTRAAALTRAGAQGTVVMFGAIVMLAFAGLLEGIGRQLVSITEVRYMIAALTAFIWGVYFYFPARDMADDER
jgi:uncharacterized membrane protein SpoIIM required for sporulation